MLFISHSSLDADLVKKFCSWVLEEGLGLTAADYYCSSVPSSKTKPGRHYPSDIESKIDEALFFVAIVTEPYRDSSYCQIEWQRAVAKRKQLLLFIKNRYASTKSDWDEFAGQRELLDLLSVEDIVRFRDEWVSVWPSSGKIPVGIFLAQAQKLADFAKDHVYKPMDGKPVTEGEVVRSIIKHLFSPFGTSRKQK